jgi:hypothetical protein
LCASLGSLSETILAASDRLVVVALERGVHGTRVPQPQDFEFLGVKSVPFTFAFINPA